jgi:hypothetical protein
MAHDDPIDALASRLIGGGNQFADLRFFCPAANADEQATGAEICAEFLRALEQKDRGIALVSQSFIDTAQKFDVRDENVFLHP